MVFFGVASLVLAVVTLNWNWNDDVMPLAKPAETIVRSPLATPAPAAEPMPQPVARVEEQSRADPVAEMPLRVSFRRPIKSEQLIGRIFNSANDPVSVAINIVATNTHRTQALQIDVPASGSASFGPDNNVQLQSGDQVTLQSAPYRDLVTSIP